MNGEGKLDLEEIAQKSAEWRREFRLRIVCSSRERREKGNWT